MNLKTKYSKTPLKHYSQVFKKKMTIAHWQWQHLEIDA
jgi:hypothetical protein